MIITSKKTFKITNYSLLLSSGSTSPASINANLRI
ncbi:hypothetical protein J532_0150, partial [Acinetobacter baumannii 940793]